MYWWDIRGLKDRLAEGPLSEPLAFRYAAAYAVLHAVTLVPIDTTVNRWDVAVYIVTILLTLLGTYRCYRVNGGADGAHFMDRYFSLGFVVVVRLFPAVLLANLFLLTVEEIVSGSSDQTTPLQGLGTASFIMLFYWRLAVHIRSLVATTSREATARG